MTSLMLTVRFSGGVCARPLTCIRHGVNSSLCAQVQYGNASAAPDNMTINMVIVTLTVRYPEPAMVPSEQAAIAAIYSQCVLHLLRPLHICLEAKSAGQQRSKFHSVCASLPSCSLFSGILCLL